MIQSILLNLIRFKRKIQHDTVTILCYHRINYKNGLFYDRNISASPEEFARQLHYLKKHFALISSKQLNDFYNDDLELPPNAVLITFDDGFKDTAHNALPVLHELHIPAIVFITTGFIDTELIPWEDRLAYLFNTIEAEVVDEEECGTFSVKTDEDKNASLWACCKEFRKIHTSQREKIVKKMYERYGVNEEAMAAAAQKAQLGYMSSEDIGFWKQRCIDFGAHTVNHAHLPSLPEKEQAAEITVSKQTLEKILGEEVRVFAYPFGKAGDYNETTRQMLKEAGFSLGMIFEEGYNDKTADYLALRRMGVDTRIPFELLSHGFHGRREMIKGLIGK